MHGFSSLYIGRNLKTGHSTGVLSLLFLRFFFQRLSLSFSARTPRIFPQQKSFPFTRAFPSGSHRKTVLDRTWTRDSLCPLFFVLRARDWLCFYFFLLREWPRVIQSLARWIKKERSNRSTFLHRTVATDARMISIWAITCKRERERAREGEGEEGGGKKDEFHSSRYIPAVMAIKVCCKYFTYVLRGCTIGQWAWKARTKCRLKWKKMVSPAKRNFIISHGPRWMGS